MLVVNKDFQNEQNKSNKKDKDMKKNFRFIKKNTPSQVNFMSNSDINFNGITHLNSSNNDNILTTTSVHENKIRDSFRHSIQKKIK